jgi:transcriptional regulator with XRE-family HTH domain
VNRKTNWAAILGANTRIRRKALGLSQEELAYRVGVDVRYLGGIERVQENPSLQVIGALAAALDTSPAGLLTMDYYPGASDPAT